MSERTKVFNGTALCTSLKHSSGNNMRHLDMRRMGNGLLEFGLGNGRSEREDKRRSGRWKENRVGCMVVGAVNKKAQYSGVEQ